MLDAGIANLPTSDIGALQRAIIAMTVMGGLPLPNTK